MPLRSATRPSICGSCRKQDVAVPVTLVCTADAFVRYLQGDPHVTQRLRDELAKTIDPRRSYAVRSSASFEDGQDYSWAGQFKTELNVQGIDAIMQAVQNVWESSHSSSARAYLGQGRARPARAQDVGHRAGDGLARGLGGGL